MSKDTEEFPNEQVTPLALERAREQMRKVMTDPEDLRDGEVDDDAPDSDGLWEADPSCINCGGQGGWCKWVTKKGQCIWRECDCVEYRGE